MKKKTLTIVLLLFAVTLSFAMFFGCDRYVIIEGIRMKETETVETTVGDFSYEGKKIVVSYLGGEQREIDLTEDMIPVEEQLKFYKIGEQEIKVVYGGRYATTFKVNVIRHSFEDVYELNGYVCTYDGKPHKVELNRELPEGAKIDYKYGNTFTNAGTYNVVGVISKDGYVSKTLTTQLVIEKAVYDLSETSFEDMTTVYDGNFKTITATNIPEGVEVTYDVYDGDIRINNAINAGEYTIIARFESNDGNYEKIPSKRAKLVIEKADYDMSRVKLNDYTKYYDGLEYTPAISNDSVLPHGVMVNYAVYRDDTRVASNANAGVYGIVASFKGNTSNYNPIPDMKATLTVNKRIIKISDRISFEDATVNFDRQTHSLAIDGDLPSNVTVSYENNDKVYAGDYEVIAKFSAVSNNETVDVEELRAYLIINTVRESVKINGHEVSEGDLYYNTETFRMVLVGLDTVTYGVRAIDFYDIDAGENEDRVEWGDPEYALIEGNSYRYSIKFYYKDEGVDNSVRLSTSSGTFTFHEIELPDTQVAYDGKEHTITAQNYPRDIVVTYDLYQGEELIDKAVTTGEYRIVAHFAYLDNPSYFPDKTATLTIVKADYDMSGISFEDVEKTYDGKDYVLGLGWDSELPSGVSVEFVCMQEGVSVTSNARAGVYQMIAKFTCEDTDNYNEIPDMVATLTVNKLVLTITVDGHEIQASDFEYDITQKYIEIFGVDQFKYNIDSLIITYKESQDSEPVTVTFGEEGTGLIDNDNYIYSYTVRFSIVSDSQEVKDSVVINDATGQFFYNDIKKVEEIDLSGVVFADTEVTYNGSAQSLTATNVPENVAVTYEYYQNGEQINQEDVIYAGEYTVVARFRPTTSDKYIKVDFMTATLTVNVFVFTGKGIEFKYETANYDGKEHYSTVKKVPAGVGVTYEYWYEKYNKESIKLDGKPVYGGTYKIYATFYAENDSVIVDAEPINQPYLIKKVQQSFYINGHVVGLSDLRYNSYNNMMSIEGLDMDTYTYVIEMRYTDTLEGGGSMTYVCTSTPEHGFNRDVLVDGREIGYEISVVYKDEMMADSVSFKYVKGTTTYHTGDFT